MTRDRAHTWIIWLAGVFALAFALDRSVAFAAEKLVLNSRIRYSILYGGKEKYDVVILGNSRAVNGFFAPELSKRSGRRVINLGSNGVSTGLAAVLWDDYLQRHPAPEALLIEVTSLFSKEEAVNDLRPYVLGSPALFDYYSGVHERAAAFTKISHAFAFNSETVFRSLYYLRKSDQSWANGGVMSPALLAATDTMAPVDLQLPQDNLDALRRIIAYARDRGIAVRLVVTPYLPAYLAKIRNLEPWIAQIESATGEKVWNFANAMTDTDAFADRLHVNRRGSVQFVEQLINSGLMPGTNGGPDSREVKNSEH
jgi:hypothetical protein